MRERDQIKTLCSSQKNVLGQESFSQRKRGYKGKLQKWPKARKRKLSD